jgi:hypothetical protein
MRQFFLNKHTSGAALVFAIVSLLGHLGNIWLPEHAVQIKETTGLLKEFCVAWMGFGAGDAKTVRCLEAKVDRTQEAVMSGDTTFIEQQDGAGNNPPPPKAPH